MPAMRRSLIASSGNLSSRVTRILLQLVIPFSLKSTVIHHSALLSLILPLDWRPSIIKHALRDRSHYNIPRKFGTSSCSCSLHQLTTSQLINWLGARIVTAPTLSLNFLHSCIPLVLILCYPSQNPGLAIVTLRWDQGKLLHSDVKDTPISVYSSIPSEILSVVLSSFLHIPSCVLGLNCLTPSLQSVSLWGRSTGWCHHQASSYSTLNETPILTSLRSTINTLKTLTYPPLFATYS